MTVEYQTETIGPDKHRYIRRPHTSRLFRTVQEAHDEAEDIAKALAKLDVATIWYSVAEVVDTSGPMFAVTGRFTTLA
jgi:hypothetical protein